jgi:hypothetical protein
VGHPFMVGVVRKVGMHGAWDAWAQQNGFVGDFRLGAAFLRGYSAHARRADSGGVDNELMFRVCIFSCLV